MVPRPKLRQIVLAQSHPSAMRGWQRHNSYYTHTIGLENKRVVLGVVDWAVSLRAVEVLACVLFHMKDGRFLCRCLMLSGRSTDKVAREVFYRAA